MNTRKFPDQKCAGADEARRASLTPRMAVCLLLCATLCAYLNSLGGDFVYDDYDVIVRNPALRSWGNLSAAFGGSLLGYYRPLVEILFTIERHVFGLHAAFWHAVNVSLHLIVSLFVFDLVRTLSRGHLPLAMLTAMFFALHPAHVESVAWVSGVSDVLMSLFFLSSLVFFLRHQEAGQNKWLAGSVIFYAAALLSKETALTLPLLVFFFARLRRPQKPPPRRMIPTLLPYLTITGVYFFARLSVLGQIFAPVPENAGVTNTQVIMTVPAVLARYALILVFPFRLSVNYGTSFVESVTDRMFVAGVALLLALAIGGLFFAATLKDSLWRIGLALLFVPLTPALFLRAFIPEILVQDRYLYLPLAGFSLLLAFALVRLAERGGNSLPPLGFVCATILILAFGAGTVAQNRVWSNIFMLQGRALAYAPHSVKAHRSLAAAFLRAGDVESARRHMVEATNRPRPNPQDLISLAGMQMVAGDLEGAEKSARQALSLRADDELAAEVLSHALLKQGKSAEALKVYVELRPHDALIQAAARGECQTVIRLMVEEQPDYESHLALAACYEARGERQESAAEIKAALERLEGSGQ